VALRRGGDPPWRAQTQLGLSGLDAARSEGPFRRRLQQGCAGGLPRFAAHGDHVAAVLREGGYPVLGARGR
jgi:hypothetical protein